MSLASSKKTKKAIVSKEGWKRKGAVREEVRVVLSFPSPITESLSVSKGQGRALLGSMGMFPRRRSLALAF